MPLHGDAETFYKDGAWPGWKALALLLCHSRQRNNHYTLGAARLIEGIPVAR
jgi:hypothetical protein